MSAPAWAKIGEHNFLVNFTVGPSLFYNEHLSSTSDYTLPGVEAVSAKALMGAEIGYLLHDVRSSGTIHGMDVRIGVYGDLPTSGYSFGGVDSAQFSNPVLLSFSLNYTPGKQFKNFRLLFDTIGLNISLAFANVVNPAENINSTGMLWGALYTLPLGTHFLFNNGVYFGVRHHIVVNPYAIKDNEFPVK